MMSRYVKKKKEYVSQPSHSASQPASHLASQPAGQRASKQASQRASQPGSQPASQPAGKPASQPASPKLIPNICSTNLIHLIRHSFNTNLNLQFPLRPETNLKYVIND
jgi:uncharacterized membrane protein